MAKFSGISIGSPALTDYLIGVTAGNIDIRYTVQTLSDFLKTNGGMWWDELGRTTLGSAGDAITVSSIPARRYLRLLLNVFPSGAVTNEMTFNGDTAASYANRNSTDGAADATQVSQTKIFFDVTGNATFKFSVADIVNIQNQEKIVIIRAGEGGTAGAGNAPSKRESVAKWANTSNQISSVTITNTAAGSYDVGSELIVLGHN